MHLAQFRHQYRPLVKAVDYAELFVNDEAHCDPRIATQVPCSAGHPVGTHNTLLPASGAVADCERHRRELPRSRNYSPALGPTTLLSLSPSVTLSHLVMLTGG